MACKNSHPLIVRWALNNGADLNAQDYRGLTPLHVAAKQNNLDVIMVLMKNKNSTLKVTDQQGETPLHLAVTYCSYNVCHYMITGEEPDLSSMVKNKKIMCIDSVKDILNNPNNFGQSVVHLAAIRGNHDIMRLLLNTRHKDRSLVINRTSLNSEDKDGLNPVFQCIVSANTHILDLLLKPKLLYPMENKMFRGKSLREWAESDSQLSKNEDLFKRLKSYTIS